MNRRFFKRLMLAGALAPASFFVHCGNVTIQAHTLYGQWQVYRKKHLLIGCHREDPRTFELAKQLEAEFAHHLPAAKARVARAPHPERLASLLGTDQLEIAILNGDDAVLMAQGKPPFEPYGVLPLTLIGRIADRFLIAHAQLPDHHAWLIRAAIEDAQLAAGGQDAMLLPLHPGAKLRQDGAPMPKAG